ncbi:carbon-nitrogen hydrolase family protein [Streptomyces montanisoli]|uniref:Carbon-nitrogen hydrolase family protein n=1 Tax=Streptomyces montanisoli TaxID=2798581 RepID=A0A940MBC7_9ACTN|nr:carbon-nitrogen hydrolase family protein [Streptomyces montanisoli]MBP0459810.1 carbon-nitrogen hydrolase family protein [Streptomyces montanisoli]
MPPLRTALLQSSGRPGRTAGNLRVLDDAARRAAEAGASLLVCPEMFLTGYAIGDGIERLAESADGPGAGAVAETAARHGVAVLYGYPERDGERVYNSARLIGAGGEPLANYRKTHLYGPFERERFAAGERPVVQAEVGGVRVGVLICYDVEFPEIVRAHALAGTDLLLVPTAQMRPFEFVAESVVPVRAFESQMYIAYVNRTGPEGDFDFVGLTCLAGPDGTAHARAGRGEELLVCDVDPALLAASREANPYLHDRRPGLYDALA